MMWAGERGIVFDLLDNAGALGGLVSIPRIETNQFVEGQARQPSGSFEFGLVVEVGNFSDA